LFQLSEIAFPVPRAEIKMLGNRFRFAHSPYSTVLKLISSEPESHNGDRNSDNHFNGFEYDETRNDKHRMA